MEWEIVHAVVSVILFVLTVGVAAVILTVALAYAFGWLA